MKVLCGLGNPGGEYEATRHNVGWWVLDRAREVWGFPRFRRAVRARASVASLDGEDVLLLKPWTYMNRSGAALVPLLQDPDFDVTRDLLVIVDEAALDAGRIRLRARGSSGGHNGLKSIEAVLRSQEYARLRIGVGPMPESEEMSDFVLSEFDEDDERLIVDLLPTVVAAARTWIEEGVEAAANRYNR